ncbi:MAG: DUF2800 domain-containing protein [Deltaproteobacteria bacterium]|nr:DUF2800 domain-containing protein [Deltaproteobacteria bacterium]
MPKQPTGHSILGASSSVRWMNCPGSVEAVKNYKNEESVYAAEGTVAHGIIADALLSKNPLTYRKTLDKKIGDTVMQGEFEIEVTEQMIDAVDEFLELVAQETESGCIIKVEERVNLQKFNTHLFGTADVVIIKPFLWIKVLDFKYGAGIKVNAYENTQGMCYLTYAWEGEDVEYGEVIICQPRKEDGTSRYQVSYKQYQEFKKDLLFKAKAALTKGAKLNAGPWCKKSFCPHFAVCTATHDLAHSIVARDFSDPIAPETLPMNKIVSVLDKSDFIVAWMNAVKTRARELMLAGERVPGYKWQSEASVEEDFSDLGDKIYAKPKLKSPAQLEKIVGKDKVADYAFKPKGDVKLVPESAKGDPLQINVRADFDD